MIKLLVEQDQIILNDFETIKEFSTFSKKNTSWEAEPGNHDDLVMGLVLFGWLANQKFFKELTDINTVSQLKELSEDRMMQELVPFGIINSGNDTYKDNIVVSTKGNNFLFAEHDGWIDVST